MLKISYYGNKEIQATKQIYNLKSRTIREIKGKLFNNYNFKQ